MKLFDTPVDLVFLLEAEEEAKDRLKDGKFDPAFAKYCEDPGDQWESWKILNAHGVVTGAASYEVYCYIRERTTHKEDWKDIPIHERMAVLAAVQGIRGVFFEKWGEDWWLKVRIEMTGPMEVSLMRYSY